MSASTSSHGPHGTPGELALVLHTHMPYVEGFGTWPFGEEWLWEAIATSYLPLLDVLERAAARVDGGRAPVTLSVTPVLADQFEAPGAIERGVRFLREVRPESHRLDIAALGASGQAAAAAELERSADDYARAAERLAELGGAGLLRRLAPHVRWTSAASHAVLPLLCLHESIELQLRTGIESHRRRFGDWGGGLWLPECAHAPWLNGALEDAGVRGTCVELTGRLPAGDPRHLVPLRTEEGPALWPIDRATIARVWAQDGYPGRPAYRAHRALTPRHHRPWANDGGPYDRERARAQVAADAGEFVAAVRERVAGGGLCVCALDTELLGHWWFEGVQWLERVLEEAAAQGLPLTILDDEALERHPPAPAPDDLGVTSWGEGGDLRTWSAPAVADLAWRARSAELRTMAAGHPSTLPPRALRELLALQSSDWAFLVYRDWASDYARQRTEGHAAALARALAGDAGLEPGVRNLAPDLVT